MPSPASNRKSWSRRSVTGRPVNAESRKWATKGDHAYNELREAILGGAIEPREHINPKLVAADLGMSIIPVREALRRLEQENLVVIEPYVGATVRELPVAEICENLLIRSELEALAMRLATPLMDDVTLDRLETLLRQHEALLADGQYGDIGALNRQFHMTAYDVIPERGLIRLIQQQWDQVPRSARAFALYPDHAAAAYQMHVRIVEAIRQGNGELAGDLTREDKLLSRAVYETRLAELDNTGTTVSA